MGQTQGTSSSAASESKGGNQAAAKKKVTQSKSTNVPRREHGELATPSTSTATRKSDVLDMTKSKERLDVGKSISRAQRPSSGIKAKKEDKPIPTETVIEKGIKHDKLVVAAIDFGTFGSGFALCTRDNYQSDTGKIYVETWNSGTNLTYKAPTCVLLKPDKTLYSFGYEAERDYADLDKENQKTHYLFRQFKMKLFSDPNLSEKTMLKDITGVKELPAIDVFALVIFYFRDKLQKYLEKKDSETGFTYNDVYWVITVPAIWDLKAKQFMRKAAKKAKIDENQLSLALEPEAASLYCRKVPVQISTMIDGGKQIATLDSGSKYLVLDLGGGTIDITAHEVVADGGLREIQQACGGYWGGTRVNEAFNRFLQKLVGGDILYEIRQNFPSDWLDICNEFEVKKCNFKGKDTCNKVTIRLPVSLIHAYKEQTDCDIRESLDTNSSFAKEVSFKRDKLSISSSLFQSFFEESLENVLGYVDELLKEPGMDDVGTLLAVGGYSESPMMVNCLKSKFKDKKVVVPSNPSLAVLKGAVIYGFEPQVIASRLCRYTYGIAKQRIFKPGVDPESRKSHHHTKQGKHWCDGVFDKHVEKGQVVKVGELQTAKEYFRVKNEQQVALLDFYASTGKDTKFIDEPECVCVGSLIIELTPKAPDDDGKILVQLGVGGTELEIKATEASTGKVYQTYCDFVP